MKLEKIKLALTALSQQELQEIQKAANVLISQKTKNSPKVDRKLKKFYDLIEKAVSNFAPMFTFEEFKIEQPKTYAQMVKTFTRLNEMITILLVKENIKRSEYPTSKFYKLAIECTIDHVKQNNLSLDMETMLQLMATKMPMMFDDCFPGYAHLLLSGNFGSFVKKEPRPRFPEHCPSTRRSPGSRASPSKTCRSSNGWASKP